MNEKGKTFTLCAVKDELTNKFLTPQYFENKEEAIRWFKYVLNKTDLWKENAAMYSLYKVGKFNDEQGYIDTEIELVQGGTAVLERS